MKIQQYAAQHGLLPADDGLIYFDLRTPPIRIEGFCEFARNGGQYLRLDPETYAAVTPMAQWHAHQTSGGCARFRTDSAYCCIRMQYTTVQPARNMSELARGGIDVYEGVGAEKKLEIVGDPITGSYAYACGWDVEGMREFSVHLPLYAGVFQCTIGFQPQAELLPPTPHALPKPILFYGSSITQGGCASRPGCAYPAIVCRHLDAEQVNLGFSGSALGEPQMARYIARQPMSAFVFDYDHNAPNAEHLARTHFAFYETVRAAQPELPILMLHHPCYRPRPWDTERFAVIDASYQKAIERGDRHVRLVPYTALFAGPEPEGCTADGTHPNDVGFARMAAAVEQALRELL